VRGVLQPFCARLAASRKKPDLLKSLEKNIEYCEKMLGKARRAFTGKDFFEIEERNVEFHRLLGEATGNPILALTVDYVEDFLMSYKKNALTPDIQHSTITIKEHHYILDCLLKGNEDETEKAMVLHLRSVEEYLEKNKQ